MNKKIVIAVVILILIVIGFYAFSTPKQQAPSPLQKVTISEAFPVFLHSPLWVAYEKGYFKDEGLDVTITTGGGDEKSWAAVLSGDAQFAVGDPTFVAISGAKGQPGVVVASVLNGVVFTGVAKDPKIPAITTPSMLKGYSVATLPEPSTSYEIQAKMFQSANLKPNLVQVALTGLIPALESGKADIALLFEPDVSTEVKKGGHIVYSLTDFYPDFAITGVTALPSYVKSNPDVVQKLVNAFQKANTLIRTNPQDAADAILKQFPTVDRDVAVNAITNLGKYGVVLPDTTTSQKGWDLAIQVRKDVGDLKVDASYTTYVDNSFAEKAKTIK